MLNVWLICEASLLKRALVCLGGVGLSGVVIWGDSRVRDGYLLCGAYGIKRTVGIVAKDKIMLAKIAKLIANKLPNETMIFYDSPWLAEMTAFLRAGKAYGNIASLKANSDKLEIVLSEKKIELASPAFLSIARDCEVFSGFNIGISFVDVVSEEFLLSCDFEDQWFKNKFTLSVDDLKSLPDLDRLKIAHNAVKNQLPLELSSKFLPKFTPLNKVWFVGGRGLCAKSEYKILSEMANKCYASVGATRAIVDCGWASKNDQIGQGGQKIIADYVFLFGVSGAIQHTEGLRQAKCIIAINTDENAQVSRYADYLIKASWHEIKNNFLGIFYNEYKGDENVDWCPKGNKGS